MHERPQELGEVGPSQAWHRAVPVDDRDRAHIAEDEVRLGQVRVARDLGALREPRALREVVHGAQQARPRLDGVLVEPVAVVGRQEPVDERQDGAAVRVDPEIARRPVESGPLEVLKQRVDDVGVVLQGPPYRVSDPDDARGRHASGEQDLLS
jgi:hypothetical protein